MEYNYPRYPVDFLRLTVVFENTARGNTETGELIIDIVRENPFGTAFVNDKRGKTNVRSL